MTENRGGALAGNNIDAPIRPNRRSEHIEDAGQSEHFGRRLAGVGIDTTDDPLRMLEHIQRIAVK